MTEEEEEEDCQLVHVNEFGFWIQKDVSDGCYGNRCIEGSECLILSWRRKLLHTSNLGYRRSQFTLFHYWSIDNHHLILIEI